MSTVAAAGQTTVEYVDRLKEIFGAAANKHEAHAHSREVVAELARDPRFLREALALHVSKPANLNRRHYPVVAVEVESNPDFEIVLNCWIPLPDRATDVSTKAIHHHGPMLLTTATVFGPGYEHWMLRRPEPIDQGRDLFRMELIDHGRHGLHEVAFVDAYTAHVPIYPESLTITVCLWSNSSRTTWKDSLKRVPALRRNSAILRRLAARAGLAKQLDLKVDDYKDYHPGDQGFIGMKARDEFPHMSNEDYLYSLFNIIQETGNSQLAAGIESQLDRAADFENPELLHQLVHDLKSGTPIAARLSPGHYGVSHANFRTGDIERALAAQG